MVFHNLNLDGILEFHITVTGCMQGIFINWFVGASSIYQARGKFDEHESSVGVAQGAAKSNSSLLKLSKCFSFSMCISFCQLCISQDMNHLESLKSA